MYAINEYRNGGYSMATAQQSNSLLNYHHTYPTHVRTRKLCLSLVAALRKLMATGQFRWSCCWSYKYRVLNEQSSRWKYGQTTPDVTNSSIIRYLCLNLWEVSASTTHQPDPITPNPCVTKAPKLLIYIQMMLVNRIIYYNYLHEISAVV